ncbi:hypothetical protein PV328_010094, partial [Microctonus aethiopoides]
MLLIVASRAYLKLHRARSSIDSRTSNSNNNNSGSITSSSSSSSNSSIKYNKILYSNLDKFMSHLET